MEKENNLHKVCKKCLCYKKFYCKSIFMFWTARQGLCAKRDEIVDERDVCAYWQATRAVKTTTIAMLDIAADDVKYLQKFYGE